MTRKDPSAVTSPYPTRVYGTSLALHTDLYQLTMAHGYWKTARHAWHAVFHHFFRTPPFGGGFTIAAGLEPLIEFVRAFAFAPDDLEYLRSLTGRDARPLFDPRFLDFLADFRFDCDIDAVPEGTVVFPQEPLVRVTGSMLACQLLETPLLNLVNFPTLIATKAARICLAAGGDPVLEFGLRRAQGIDGGLTASRAAYIGGCAATSNLLAGKIFAIPVKGTHAHSWVMLFDSEIEAFDAYADAMPNNCVFLVDTYRTLDGVAHAIEAGKRLRARGRQLAGIRLDSGDLAYLATEARRMLDAAGFQSTAIVASNDLDEETIASLRDQGAPIAVWGVGTRLATAWGQPALGGVYKLAAVRRPGQAEWQPCIKVSEQIAKTTNPGILQVRRFVRSGECVGDMIFDVAHPPEPPCRIVDPLDPLRHKTIPADARGEDLLVPVFRRGECVMQPPALEAVRARTAEQLARFHPGIRRFVHPHAYPVGLEHTLHARRASMIEAARANGA